MFILKYNNEPQSFTNGTLLIASKSQMFSLIVTSPTVA